MSQIASATAIDRAVNGPTNRFAEMESDDFLRIIFTELTNQDPLAPSDTSALLEQLNSIRSIESDLQLTNQLKALVTENQLASASSVLGKTIVGLTETLDSTTGVAVSARREGDKISVELDNGNVVPFESITHVIAPETVTPPGGQPL